MLEYVCIGVRYPRTLGLLLLLQCHHLHAHARGHDPVVIHHAADESINYLHVTMTTSHLIIIFLKLSGSAHSKVITVRSEFEGFVSTVYSGYYANYD